MSPMLWLLIGAVALLGEALNTQLFLLNVGVAAFIVAPLALVLGPSFQVVLFVVFSLLLLGMVRPRLLHALAGAAPRRTLTNQGRLIDRAAVVTHTVTVHGGMIRVGAADFWTARTNGPLPPIPVGQTVRIAYVDGLTAYIEPVIPITEASGDAVAPRPSQLVEAQETQERGE